MKDKQVYKLRVPGQPAAYAEVSTPEELAAALVGVGTAADKAQAMAGAMWGEVGGDYKTHRLTISHIGHRPFISNPKQVRGPGSGGTPGAPALEPRATPSPALRTTPSPSPELQTDRLFD